MYTVPASHPIHQTRVTDGRIVSSVYHPLDLWYNYKLLLLHNTVPHLSYTSYLAHRVRGLGARAVVKIKMKWRYFCTCDGIWIIFSGREYIEGWSVQSFYKHCFISTLAYWIASLAGEGEGAQRNMTSGQALATCKAHDDYDTTYYFDQQIIITLQINPAQ